MMGMTNFNILGFVPNIPRKYCNKDLRPRAITLIEIWVWLNVEEFAYMHGCLVLLLEHKENNI